MTIRIKTKKFFSKNCRQFAEENFEMEKCINEYISLYKEMIRI